MAKVKGTSVLLYFNGKAVAMQTGLNLTINDALIDGSNKESLGWYEGTGGQKDAKIDFKSLFATGVLTDNPAILGAKDLVTYLLARNKLLVSILDIGYPIVGQVNMSSLTFDAPNEGAMAVSGSMRVIGKLYPLANIGGLSVNLVTDPDAGGSNYDIEIVEGTIGLSCGQNSGSAYCRSNAFSVQSGDVYKLLVYCYLSLGQVPSVAIYDNTSADISNVVALTNGLNMVTLTVTNTDATASLKFRNTAQSGWSIPEIYLFKA